MLNNTEIQPALTAEEWETWRKEGHVTRNDQMILHSKGIGFAGVPRISAYMVPMDTETHACAAVCLDSQPFGFTRDDADNIEYVMREWGKRVPVIGDDILKLANLRERILALLPPE